MKRQMIFLGPPACGKGTQTAKLAEHFGLPHVDTGSLLRAEIKAQSENGMIAKQYIDKGHLVPPELVGSIIKERLSCKDCANGYILDGYPRSLKQAEILEEINAELNGDEKVNFMAIYFDVDESVLITRIVNRRSCSICGEIYNLKFHPTQKDGICDKCGGELTQRKDDTEEIATERFETYRRETAPLIEYYRQKGVLKNLNANGTIKEVWERLLKIAE